MSVATGILAFFLILALLVLVHETGHFTVAKLLGVRVEEFGLGFPPRLKTWRRGKTSYSLNALPLGGFVRMAGENGESDRPDSFGAKAPWQRLAILAAGPLMNLVLAIGIFFAAYTLGTPRAVTVVTAVQPGSPASRAGIQRGDRIVTINGRSVQWYDALAAMTKADAGRRVTLGIERGGLAFSTALVPRMHPPVNQGRMGITLGKTVTVAYGPADALGRSVADVGGMIASVPEILRSVAATGGAGVEGPIGIAHTTTTVVGQEPSQGPGTVLQLMALLSANLGVLNLLPIPALDGGRILFVMLSWLRRRNLDPEVEGMIHALGMAALLILILFVSYQDLARWVSGGSF